MAFLARKLDSNDHDFPNKFGFSEDCLPLAFLAKNQFLLRARWPLLWTARIVTPCPSGLFSEALCLGTCFRGHLYLSSVSPCFLKWGCFFSPPGGGSHPPLWGGQDKRCPGPLTGQSPHAPLFWLSEEHGVVCGTSQRMSDESAREQPPAGRCAVNIGRKAKPGN